MKNRTILLLGSSLILTACGTTTNVSNKDENVEIKFKALADNQEIECGKTYKNIGTSKTKVSIADFRFYISNVSLINNKGETVALKLNQDKKWQNGMTALLDFENKLGDCSSGNSDLNKKITGTIATGNYKSLKFTLGIPFKENHQDATKAESPFNVTSMFWTWNVGYKFARIDLKTDSEINKDYYIHLGSTGCKTSDMSLKHEGHDEHSGMNSEVPSMCENTNEAQIILDNFDVNKNTVVADLSALLADTDLNIDTQGCMFTTDPVACKAITGTMNNFGLKFGNSESKGQKFFRVQ